MITKNDLDTRICDYYDDEEITNPETFREFIRNSEKDFEFPNKNLENLNDKELNEYMEFLDYLWSK